MSAETQRKIRLEVQELFPDSFTACPACKETGAKFTGDHCCLCLDTGLVTVATERQYPHLADESAA